MMDDLGSSHLDGTAMKCLPPTNKKVSFTGIDIFRVVEGKKVEHWDEADQLGFLRQLGLAK